MSSITEALETLEEEQYSPTDVPFALTLRPAPRHGFFRLIAYLRALTAPDAGQQPGRNRRTVSSYQQTETPLDILIRKYPDIYIRCMCG